MEMNKENTAIYGNSLYFTSSTIPKPVISISGDIYVKAFLKGQAVISKSKQELEDENLYIKPLILSEKEPYQIYNFRK